MPLAFARHPLAFLRTRIRRIAPSIATVGSVWLCMTASGWAQEYQQEVEEKTYVPSYMIIVFAVGFALLMICRSGKRTTSFRREE